MEQFTFSLEDFLPYKLVRTAEQVADSLAELYQKEFGITRPEWRILANLGAREDVIARDLSDVTNLDKVKVSRTLSKLEEKGLIQREKTESDQRATHIQLTEEGRRLYEKMIPRVLQWESEILDGLTGSQYRDLFRALDALKQSTDVVYQKHSGE
ncbi:MarR family winged helix-turn-helix transcriptional regulator [Vibrio penaeicida]|uniref:Transcriptional regulator n=1 Tax=Vibrio penaeicida TaxID=104609 RepID=A0AAV5NUF2_9VIBR|nr:MarR family transcriptional regulator [Vibrio penaeicida]RTZ19152.1 MarR family transcriptional regulator [Vibrio penaeicida]GLQ74230.1 transcriptional regulator [Vibrio penaeicida]